MPGPARGQLGAGRDLLGLIALVGVCLAVSALGGAITATSVGTWYQGLEKPSFNPPDWVFAPVWTTLYILMGLAAWRVWRLGRVEGARAALVVFGAQLGLTLAWSLIFFGFEQIAWALLEIVVLFLAVIANTAMFWRIDRLAGGLIVPYAAWVAYATLLNAALWLLNSA